MFKTLTVVFLTLFAMSSYAIDKYDFFVDKGLPCADRKVIEQNFMKVVGLQPSKQNNPQMVGGLIFIFKKIKTYEAE